MTSMLTVPVLLHNRSKGFPLMHILAESRERVGCSDRDSDSAAVFFFCFFLLFMLLLLLFLVVVIVLLLPRYGLPSRR